MYNNVSAADINTTMNVKFNELTPSIEPNTESLFHRCVDSGYTVTIDTPVARNNKNGLFGINLCGFIPDFTLPDPNWTLMQKNMCPVQPFSSTRSFVTVKQDMVILPVMHAMMSNRFCSGTVNVLLRISSNTGQTGNLIVTQQSGLIPRVYGVNENYQGVRFQNDGHHTSDPMICNFSLADVSMVRQVGFRTIFRQPVAMVDIQKKIFEFSTTSKSPESSSQFPEDWLFVGLISDLPQTTASQLYIRVLFDYSEVSFYQSMYPIMPAIPHNPSQQILMYSKTFVDTSGNKKADAVFLPANQNTFEQKVNDALAALQEKQLADLILKEAKDRLAKTAAKMAKMKQEAKDAVAAKNKDKDNKDANDATTGNTIPKQKSSS